MSQKEMNPPATYSDHSPPQPGFNIQPIVQPVPVNLGVAQPLNANPYGYQPVAQPPIIVLNATPRTYSYWPGRRYGPYNRRASYIAIGIFAVVMLIFVVIFLAVFFTVMKKQEDFHNSFFNHQV